MSPADRYTLPQTTALFLLRMAVGWHLLYEGLTKLFDPNWSSYGFLSESQWILKGFAEWILSSEGLLKTADLLNIWGLIAIGAGLLLGLFARPAALAGAILLLFYYLSSPPLTGMSYSLPSEGSYLIVNKTLIEALALLVLYLFPTSRDLGIDRLIFPKKHF